MGAGRPTKYSEEVLEKAKDYLANYRNYGDVVPTIEGLACELQVNRNTLYDWASNDEYHEFSNTFTTIKEKQARLLLSGGLTSELNTAITKLMLANHGYRDKQVVDNTSSDGSMSPQPNIIEIVPFNGEEDKS